MIPADSGMRALLWLGVAGATALLFGLAPAPALRIALFLQGSVPVVLLCLVVCAALSWRVARRAARHGDAHGPGALVAPAVLTLIVVAYALILPPRLRVLADDYQILGAGVGIVETGRPVVPSQGIWSHDGALEAAEYQMDKRGVLTPTLVALASAGGYSAQRAFALSLALGWLALGAFYLALRTCLSRAAALGGVLLLASYPVMAWTSRSVCLEVANLACLAGVTACLIRAWRDRDGDCALLAAWLAPLAAQARYESVLLAAFALPTAAWLCVRTERPRWERILALAAPFALLPYLWQRAAPVEFGMDEVSPAVLFGVRYLQDNLGSAAALLLRTGSANPLGPAIPLLAAAGLVVLAFGFRRAHDRGAAALVAGAALLPALSVIAVVMAFAWGNLLDPATHRLGIPLLALLCGLAAVTLDFVVSKARAAAIAAPVAAAAAWAWSVPQMHLDEAYRSFAAAPALFEARQWALDQVPGCRVLWVTPYATYFLVYGDGAISPTAITRDWARVRDGLARGRENLVIGLQVADLATHRPLRGNELPGEFEPQPLAEGQVTSGAAVRMVLLDRPDAPVPAPCTGGLDALRKAAQAAAR